MPSDRGGNYILYYPSYSQNNKYKPANEDLGVVSSKRLIIDIQQMLSSEFIKIKFNKIINLYPNILIYGKYTFYLYSGTK